MGVLGVLLRCVMRSLTLLPIFVGVNFKALCSWAMAVHVEVGLTHARCDLHMRGLGDAGDGEPGVAGDAGAFLGVGDPIGGLAPRVSEVGRVEPGAPGRGRSKVCCSSASLNDGDL